MKRKNKSKGFTLIELLITITIISILIAIAIPSYQNYTRRAHYTEVVQAAAPFKIGIEECYQITNDLRFCQGGQNGVPKNIEHEVGSNLIDSILVSDGKITITPKDKYGIKPIDNYILTPKIDNDQLSWSVSGGGVERGYTH